MQRRHIIIYSVCAIRSRIATVIRQILASPLTRIVIKEIENDFVIGKEWKKIARAVRPIDLDRTQCFSYCYIQASLI